MRMEPSLGTKYSDVSRELMEDISALGKQVAHSKVTSTDQINAEVHKIAEQHHIKVDRVFHLTYGCAERQNRRQTSPAFKRLAQYK